MFHIHDNLTLSLPKPSSVFFSGYPEACKTLVGSVEEETGFSFQRAGMLIDEATFSDGNSLWSASGRSTVVLKVCV